MGHRTKNTVGIALILIVAVAVIAGVVVVAVDANSVVGGGEYFIDTAPVNYSDPDNIIYVMKFRSAVEKFFSTLDENYEPKLSDRLLDALSRSRVPAYKLGGMADALDKHAPSNIFSSFDDWEIDEDDVEAIFSVSNFQRVSRFLRDFLTESRLTGEEFGQFLYIYLDSYGGGEQRGALTLLGRDKFIALIGSITTLVTYVGNADTGIIVADYNAISAAFYQLGSVFIMANGVGNTNFEKALGLFFRFDNNDKSVLLNGLAEAIDGKTGDFLAMVGYVLREADRGTVETALNAKDEDEKIYAHVLASRAAKRGLAKFSTDYGVENVEEWVTEYLDGLNKLLAYSAGDGSDYEELVERAVGKAREMFDAIELLTSEEFTLSDTSDLKGSEKYDGLTAATEAIDKMDGEADVYFSTLIFLWLTVRVDEYLGISGGKQ